ncbi:transmembrane protein 80-like isoform X2 [Fopius arisanus]|uniref:Transmembrane protein 80-like isoform X2 n=1 Tax=Fopius arisanus TaxID=64838 RepID=A0A9R1TSK3_9HYME|nr:PREDICTED: transmembrane protein 80-like isoform X2 [Fopius arisanus]
MPTVANSSLTYEILMYLNSFYFGIFALSELTMGIIKAIEIPSPNSGTTITEFSLLIFLVATEGGRVYLGRKGNLTELCLQTGSHPLQH